VAARAAKRSNSSSWATLLVEREAEVVVGSNTYHAFTCSDEDEYLQYKYYADFPECLQIRCTGYKLNEAEQRGRKRFYDAK